MAAQYHMAPRSILPIFLHWRAPWRWFEDLFRASLDLFLGAPPMSQAEEVYLGKLPAAPADETQKNTGN
jgi:hypothetical protein